MGTQSNPTDMGFVSNYVPGTDGLHPQEVALGTFPDSAPTVSNTQYYEFEYPAGLQTVTLTLQMSVPFGNEEKLAVLSPGQNLVSPPQEADYTIAGATGYFSNALPSGTHDILSDNSVTWNVQPGGGTAIFAIDGVDMTLAPGATSVTYDPSAYNIFVTANREALPSPVVASLDAISQDIERLYYSLLNRPADQASLSADKAILSKNPKAIASIANSLIRSKEYVGLHGHQSNAQFVEALYEGAFGRTVDAGALASDTRALNHSLTRQSLAASLAESPEAVAHLSTKTI